MAQQVTCANCKRTYAVKPEFAGKRAKCKCGTKIQFPAAEAEVLTEADLMDDVLSEADLLDENPTPATLPGKGRAKETLDEASDPYSLMGETSAVAPPPVQVGTQCRNCRAALGPGTVICTSCGMNQQSGAMIRTMVTAAPRPVPRPTASSGGDGSGMRNVLIGGGVCLLGVVVTAIGFMNPDSNGGFRVMIGAIVFGGIQFLKGMMQLMNGD